jgi:hypothetical protein
MWVVDIRHLLDDTHSRPALPRFSFKVKRLGQIVTYATATAAGISVDFQPTCRRRPRERPCQGVLEIELRKDHILWECPACGDEGVILGWKGLIWDMTVFAITYLTDSRDDRG